MTKGLMARLLVLTGIAGSALVGCVDVDGREATHSGAGEVAAWALLAHLEGEEN